jgi:hypothetical protein
MSLFSFHPRAPFHFDWTKRRGDGSKEFPTPSAQEALQASRNQASRPTPYPDTKKSDKARRQLISEPVRRKTLTQFQVTRKYGLAITRETCQEHAWAREVMARREEKSKSDGAQKDPKTLVKEMRGSTKRAPLRGALGEIFFNIRYSKGYPNGWVSSDHYRGPAHDCAGLPDLPMLANKKSWQLANTHALESCPDFSATPETADLGFYDLLRMTGPLQTSNLHQLQKLTVAMAPDPKEDGTAESTNPTLDLSANHRLEELNLHNWKKLPAVPALSPKAPIRKVSVVHCQGGIDSFPAVLGDCPHLTEIDWQGTPLKSLPEEIYTWRKDIKILLTKNQVAPVLVAQIKARRADPNYKGPDIQMIDMPPPEPKHQPSLDSEVARWHGRAASNPVQIRLKDRSGAAGEELEQAFARFLFNAIDIEPRESTADRISKVLYAMARSEAVAIRCMNAAVGSDISDTDACANALVVIEAAAAPNAPETNLGRKVGHVFSEIARWRAIGKHQDIVPKFGEASPAIPYSSLAAFAKFLFHAIEITPQKACAARVNQMLEAMEKNPDALKVCVEMAGNQTDFSPAAVDQSLTAMQAEIGKIGGRNRGLEVGNFTSEAERWLTAESTARAIHSLGNAPTNSRPFVHFLFNAHDIEPYQGTVIRMNKLLETMADDPELRARCFTIAASSTGKTPQAHEATLQAMEDAADKAGAPVLLPLDRSKRFQLAHAVCKKIVQSGNARLTLAGHPISNLDKDVQRLPGDRLGDFVLKFLGQVPFAEAFVYRIQGLLTAVDIGTHNRPGLIKSLDDIASFADVGTAEKFKSTLHRLETTIQFEELETQATRRAYRQHVRLYSRHPSAVLSSDSENDAHNTNRSASELDRADPFAPSAPPFPSSDGEG